MKKSSVRKFNNILLSLLFVLVCFISVAYSAVNTELLVSGNLDYSYKTKNLYEQVKLDFMDSSKYVRMYNGDTSSFKGDKDIYYYYGKAQNNNVRFANYCWKIIRTTDTGGVKLLYNGVPSIDGVCNNSGSDAVLTSEMTGTGEAKVAFNKEGLLGHVGYMYNKNYPTKRLNNVLTRYFYYISSNNMSMDEEHSYYYSDNFEYRDSKYYMNNPIKYNWSDNNDSIVGKYTCKSTSDVDGCSSLYYVIRIDNNVLYYATMNKGLLSTVSSIFVGESYSISSDMANINNPVEISLYEWIKSYDKYKGYYVCANDSSSCDKSLLRYLPYTSANGYEAISLDAKYKYGNGITWDGEKYTLVDTVDILDYPNSQDIVNNHRYTCLNLSDVCEKVNYVYYIYGNTNLRLVELSGGVNVSGAINDMLYDDDVNINNSTIKETIDYWYSNNMAEYTKYLEDTVWCNNRNLAEEGSWNPNVSFSYLRFINDKKNLTCLNLNDRFTVNIENGNGALVFPAGQIDYTELTLAYEGTSPFNILEDFWTMTPNHFSYNDAWNNIFSSKGYGYYSGVYTKNYVRPAVSLKSDMIYKEGDGSVESPYVISENDN